MVKKASSLSALGGLVYSTDGGRHCPDCQQPKDACICGQAVAPVGDGIARVRRETKGRGGKTVTTISGLPLAGDALKELASALKRRCGTGGSLKDGVVEIQGEHVELLIDELLKRGFKAKKSGGWPRSPLQRAGRSGTAKAAPALSLDGRLRIPA